ncbi:Methyltransf-25 domain-containing protein [Mycena venus]|uniref:Methyltransf-25 domain-containing protein n=1 Tax=Mycena venus TaxID=2733690 RepID=A0A8H6YUX1_9AGAR|nr:Methyltransf-25 domain-containing protein [Mycena venus]
MSSKRPATSPGPGPGATMVSGTRGADGGGPQAPANALHKRHSTSTFTTPEPAPQTAVAPPRPPRNPARPGASERKPKKPKRPSTATGAREEVTPWEFFPVNAPTEELPILTSEETAKHSTATATGKREDVVPWELFPAPDYDAAAKPAINGSHVQANHTRSSPSQNPLRIDRPASSPGKILQRTRAHHLPPWTQLPLHVLILILPTRNRRRTHSSMRSSRNRTTTSSYTRRTKGQDPKFSTADRTILQELKRNINARAAQFVIKGGPAGTESGLGRTSSLRRAGSKHHAYNREEVPYPRSYAREVLDLDVWEAMACQRICDSLTFHVFTTPPTKVLDIGCGTGTWILNCGMAWKKCHFVGLDVVPLHPDLGTSELSTRITWVQANFLEGLPFPNEEFDYVHIKRIALGVPEDQWDALFEEVARVLKSGGAFELIEEDLFFPGKTITEDDDSDSDAVSELRYAHNDSASDGNEDDEGSVITGTGSGGSRISYDGSAPTPNTSLGAAGTPPRTSSPLPMIGSLIREEIVEEAEPDQRAPVKKSSLPSAHGHPPHHRHSYQQRVSSISHPATTSTTSLLAGLGPAVVPVVPPSVPPVERRTKPRGYSTSTLVSPTNHHPSILSLKSANSGEGTMKPAFSPFLLRSLPKAPQNPRDHSLLEGIYNEMNATRFINLSPLSLLANLLTFPPPVAKPPEIDDFTTDDESDSDDARNAIVPSPRRRQSAMSGMPGSILGSSPNTPRSAVFSDGSTTIAEEPRWVNTKDLLKRESRYIVLDEARRSAYSPATRSSFPAMSPVLRSISGLPGIDAEGGDGHQHPPPKLLPIYRSPEGQNRLPNNTFNIDIRTLNMHLALRVAEIVACTESMWEWVVSYQASSRVPGRPRAGSLASELPPRASRVVVRPDPATDAFKTAVLELNREDFDALLVRFELDMRDHMAIGSTLRDQFSWPSIPSAPSQDRKAFHAACERWDQWQEHQRRKLLSPYGRHQARNSIDSSYVHAHEGNGVVDRPAGPKPDVIRGRTSFPAEPISPSSSSQRKTSPSKAPPDRRLTFDWGHANPNPGTVLIFSAHKDLDVCLSLAFILEQRFHARGTTPAPDTVSSKKLNWASQIVRFPRLRSFVSQAPEVSVILHALTKKVRAKLLFRFRLRLASKVCQLSNSDDCGFEIHTDPGLANAISPSGREALRWHTGRKAFSLFRPSLFRTSDEWCPI